MEAPIDTARRYMAQAAQLRRTLNIAPNALLELHDLAQGEHNANFWFIHPDTGQKFVLRVNYVSQLGLDQQISYEYAALNELAASGRTPRPLFVDDTRELTDHGVMVIEFLEGRRLDCDRSGDYLHAAPALADIHSVAYDKHSMLLCPADPLRDQFESCVKMYAVYQRFSGADEQVLRRMDEFIARTRSAVEAHESSAPTSRSIINTEAVPAHFLIPEDGKHVHMVDWEKAILGEAAQDVAYFLSPTTSIWDNEHIYTPAERAAFVEAYLQAAGESFDAGAFERRFDAYVKTNCLVGLTWSCKAVVDYANPKTPLKNEKTRQKLQTYLSEEYQQICWDICYKQAEG